MKKTYLLIGGSRGIGLAVAEHLSSKHHLFAVSRSKSPYGHWIKADLEESNAASIISSEIGDAVLDGILYLGGTWEKNAFTDGFDFSKSSPQETERVLKVNLITPIHLVQSLAPSLAKSKNAKVIFIGALTGLPNLSSKEVANTASKFGLQGIIHSLQKSYSKTNICFTVINPGNIATHEVLNDIESGMFKEQTTIPLEDIIKSVDFVLSTSNKCQISEINLWQR